MKKTTIIAIILTGLTLLFACIKDTGNYNYKAIEEYEVDFNFKEGSYEWMDFVSPGVRSIRIQRILMYAGAVLNIEPIIRHRAEGGELTDTARYDFTWKAWSAASSNPNAVQTVGTFKNLNFLVNLPTGGSFFVRYRITDKKTQVFFEEMFLLQVVDGFTNGLVVMSEVNGQTRLQMVAESPEGERFIEDVLTAAQSELPDYVKAGKPIAMYLWRDDPMSPSRIAFYILTSTGTHRLAWQPFMGLDETNQPTIPVSAFAWRPSWSLTAHFLSPRYVPENFVADRILYAGSNVLLAGGGNVYQYKIVHQLPWADPNNRLGRTGAIFRVSSEIAGYTVVPAGSIGWVIFDEGSKSFRQIPVQSYNSFAEVIRNDPRNSKPWENTGMELIALRTHLTNAPIYIYGVMKAPNGDYTIFRANHTDMVQDPQWRGDALPKTAQTGEPLDFDRARLWTVGGNFKQHIYFAIDGKLYVYHILDNIIRLGVDLGGVEITHLSFNLGGGSLIVGTYDGTHGSLSRYAIPAHREPFVKMEWGYGYPFGRIVDVRSRVL
jgi:hypothetical protein